MDARITKCPACFVRPPSTPERAYVPNGDGTYTVHIARSFYTDDLDRDCDWQRQHQREQLASMRGEAGA